MARLTITMPDALESVVLESVEDNYMATVSEEIRRCLLKVYAEEGRIGKEKQRVPA